MAFDVKTREAEPVKREELIAMLSEVSKKMYLRITAEKFREKATDDTFLKFCRTWSGLTQALTAVLRDQELEEMEARITDLEREPPQREQEREMA